MCVEPKTSFPCWCRRQHGASLGHCPCCSLSSGHQDANALPSIALEGPEVPSTCPAGSLHTAHVTKVPSSAEGW